MIVHDSNPNTKEEMQEDCGFKTSCAINEVLSQLGLKARLLSIISKQANIF